MSTPSLPAILLIGHGTRIAAGVAEFHALAAQLQQALPGRRCEVAFLELAKPSVPEALTLLWQEGIREVLVLPAFLLTAGHVKSDVPALLGDFEATHPGLSITYGPALDVHPALLTLACERIAAAETLLGAAYDRRDSLLLVIGRGSSDPDANANMYRITRLLWERLGFVWAETCYTAVARPYMDEALARVHRLGFRHLVVFPYLLFAGRLTEQVEAVVAAHRAAYPTASVTLASYLNAHPLTMQAFLERLAYTQQMWQAQRTSSHTSL